MPVRAARPVDVDVVPVAVRGKELDVEIGEKRMQPRLVRSHPFATELVRLASDLRVPEAAADTVACFEHDDILALASKPRCRDQAGDPGSDDCDVHAQLARAHRLTPPLPRAAAAAARPVRTAPSM